MSTNPVVDIKKPVLRSKGCPKGISDKNAPINENINSLGNHLGIWDLGLSLDSKN